MTKPATHVIQEAIEELGPHEGWESDLSAGQAVVDALEKHGYRIIRYRVVKEESSSS